MEISLHVLQLGFSEPIGEINFKDGVRSQVEIFKIGVVHVIEEWLTSYGGFLHYSTLERVGCFFLQFWLK